MSNKVAIFWPGDYRAKPNELALSQSRETTTQLVAALKKLGRSPYLIDGYLTRPDESIAKLMESNGITCATQTAADFMALGSGFGSIIGMDSCIGSWGPLFPRQMRERGLNPIAASAKTAYRAMSLARTSFGTMAFPLGIEGKMQQVYPTVSQCFHPGEPLPQVTGKPAMLSPNGVYGWVYWRPGTCCVPKGGAGGCFL